MYTPRHFEVRDEALILEIIEAHPFVILVSLDESGSPFFSHIPVVAKKTEHGIRILGHVARQNPQWKHLERGAPITVIVNGPHAYISPTWYRSGRDVPTWNYAAIHLKGRATLIQEFEPLVGLLRTLSNAFEPSPVSLTLPDDLRDENALLKAIVGFEISVESFESKFKLSQNRPARDRQGVIEGLKQRTDEGSQAVCKLMQSFETSAAESKTSGQ